MCECSPMDQESKKYVRLLLDLEVEVLDDIALRAASLWSVDTPDGLAVTRRMTDMPGFPGLGQALEIGQVLAWKLMESLSRDGDAGIRVLSAAPMPRRVSEYGTHYREHMIPSTQV